MMPRISKTTGQVFIWTSSTLETPPWFTMTICYTQYIVSLTQLYVYWLLQKGGLQWNSVPLLAEKNNMTTAMRINYYNYHVNNKVAIDRKIIKCFSSVPPRFSKLNSALTLIIQVYLLLNANNKTLYG